MFTTKPSQQKVKLNRAKYLSNSISITKHNVVPALFQRYYNWLTNSVNLYKATVGVLVNAFSLFPETQINIKNPADKKRYVDALETIAYGIIKKHSMSEDLGLFEYINYQVTALKRLFKCEGDIKDSNMIASYKNLFYVQDTDNDGKLDVKDLAVSIAYLDMQDGVLDGNFQYIDAITLGEDIDKETGRFKMRLELKHLREFLYEE